MTDHPVIVADEKETLARHGIVRVDVPRYDVDGFHYNTLSEAVAQAKRSQRV
jgi:hypothetical protein